MARASATCSNLVDSDASAQGHWASRLPVKINGCVMGKGQHLSFTVHPYIQHALSFILSAIELTLIIILNIDNSICKPSPFQQTKCCASH